MCRLCVWPWVARHRLDAGADDVVVHVLRRQAPAAGLAVGAQRQALGVLGIELLDDLGPEHPGGAESWRPP